MTRTEEIASLKAKLASSQRMGAGYADRVEAITARLRALESVEATQPPEE